MKRNPLALLTIGTLLIACAPNVDRQLTRFEPVAPSRNQSIALATSIKVLPSSGYYCELKAGSVWRLVGTIPQGAVYKIENDVLIIKGAHSHEAFGVIRDGKLVGFYLPFEEAFAPVEQPVNFPVKQSKND